MTGVEQTVVWLASIVFGSAAMSSAVESWTAARVEIAKHNAQAHVDGYRAIAQAQAQAGQLTVPADWIPGGEL